MGVAKAPLCNSRVDNQPHFHYMTPLLCFAIAGVRVILSAPLPLLV
jgi:hypothetical protein